MRLLQHRPRWSLTWRGHLLLLSLLFLTATLFVHTIHPFLAVSKPHGGEILVVEGWINDDALIRVAEVFRSGSYSLLITTGTPMSHGKFLGRYKHTADLAADTLIALGLDAEKVVAAHAKPTKRNRTLTSAIAVRHWLLKNHRLPRKLDLVTLGTHARRSWILFRMVFLDTAQVGVISLRDRSYQPEYWWRSSAGLRAVFSETIGYFHTLLLLEPADAAIPL